jgi:capsular polysaccharide transport system ATP-binding protein
MIRLEKVSKCYPTINGLHYVLRDATIEIPARAQVGVLGRNGAGKSTLMRMLAGVDVPNSGRIIKWGSENTRFACRIQGLHYDEMAPIIDFVQSFAEIGDYFDMPARVYSSGMRGRLGFGITMAFDFDFYIIDELTAVGDMSFKDKARKIFQEKRRKAGFVRASHSFAEIRAECSSGLVIHDARLEYFPDIEEAIARYESLSGISEGGGGKSAKAARKARGGAKRAGKSAGAAGSGVRLSADVRRKVRRARRKELAG